MDRDHLLLPLEKRQRGGVVVIKSVDVKNNILNNYPAQRPANAYYTYKWAFCQVSRGLQVPNRIDLAM